VIEVREIDRSHFQLQKILVAGQPIQANVLERSVPFQVVKVKAAIRSSDGIMQSSCEVELCAVI